MKFLTVIMLMVAAYAFVRFMLWLIKELTEFAVEAWRDIEIKQ